MQFNNYVPPSGHPLHPYILGIWRVESDHLSETILPKQNVDILFNLGASRSVTDRLYTHTLSLNDFHIAGPQTGAFTVSPLGPMKLLGVSLRMDACSAILDLPITELTDQTVEARNIFPQHRCLWDQVAEAHSFEAQCSVLMQWLGKILQPTPHLDLVQYACWSLREQPTSHTLDELAAQLNLSSRHLRRIMLHHVGVGPAHYMRLSRFVKSLHMMPKTSSLTEIAYNVHYSDQAHFCRDFKEISGMTPNEYRQRMSHVPGHIFSK